MADRVLNRPSSRRSLGCADQDALSARQFRTRVSRPVCIPLWVLMCLLGATGGRAQQPAAAAKREVHNQTVEQRIDQLSIALTEMQAQMEASRQQMQSMVAELSALRTMLTERGEALDHPPLTSIEEEQQQMQAQIDEQHQVKVESASRLPVRVTGMVLFNAFVNDGVVDQVDLPSAALVRTPGSSHVSVGGGMRQTILGLAGSGPTIWGARTSGYASLDFFGGVTASTTSGPAGIVRMRTAGIAADWKDDSLRAGYETPLISPLSPSSLATVAIPALAWAGNLWTWAPQLAWRHSLMQSSASQWTLDLGLLDTQAFGAANSQVLRPVGAGENSGQPSYEARVGWLRPDSAQGEHAYGEQADHLAFGASGYYGRQHYPGEKHVDTWAGTFDAAIPLSHKLDLTGEFYRGRGLGSLGGGAYRDVISYIDPVAGPTVEGLDATGGWAQFALQMSPVLTWHIAGGQDSGSGVQLRESLNDSVTNPLYFYARNRDYTTNVFYRPWASLTISPEYRRILSWPINGAGNKANIFTFSAGYQF